MLRCPTSGFKLGKRVNEDDKNSKFIKVHVATAVSAMDIALPLFTLKDTVEEYLPKDILLHNIVVYDSGIAGQFAMDLDEQQKAKLEKGTSFPSSLPPCPSF